jgi:hypothetical protein
VTVNVCDELSIEIIEEISSNRARVGVFEGIVDEHLSNLDLRIVRHQSTFCQITKRAFSLLPFDDRTPPPVRRIIDHGSDIERELICGTTILGNYFLCLLGVTLFS